MNIWIAGGVVLSLGWGQLGINQNFGLFLNEIKLSRDL